MEHGEQAAYLIPAEMLTVSAMNNRMLTQYIKRFNFGPADFVLLPIPLTQTVEPYLRDL